MGRTVLFLMAAATACSGPVAAAPVPSSMPATASTVAEALPSTTTSTSVTTTAVPRAGTVFVVWMPDGLHPDFREIALSIGGVTEVTVVEVATMHIAETRTAAGEIVDSPPRRYVIPVQGVVLDADTYSAFVEEEPGRILGSLRPDELVLGSSSAQLRRLGPGDRIIFEGGLEARVAAVVDDAVVGSSELVAATGDLAVANSQRRYALVRFQGSVERLEGALNEAVPGSEPVRVRDVSGASGRRPVVRSQLLIKQTFGEFSYRPTSGGRVIIDPEWVDTNIATVNLPLLGRTTCHRVLNELLEGVMQSLADDGLASVIDRSAFRGCWVARYMAGSARLSKHSWGAAADINFGNSLSGGPGSPVNEELISRMAAVGITSGHDWTNPDPGHFEYYGLDGPRSVPDLSSADGAAAEGR